DFTFEREGDERVVEVGDSLSGPIRPDPSEGVERPRLEPGYHSPGGLYVLAHPDPHSRRGHGGAGEPRVAGTEVRLIIGIGYVFEAQLSVGAIRVDFALDPGPVGVHLGDRVADDRRDAGLRRE